MNAVRWSTAAFFVLYSLAVTWPGAVPFNRVDPRFLGMPLSMTWTASWLVLAFVVLLVLDRHETAEEDRRESGGGAARQRGGGGARDRERGPGGPGAG